MLRGKQIILDLYNCNYDILSNKDLLDHLMEKTMTDYNIPILSHYYQEFDDASFSCILFHNYGHIIIHAFPELGFASVDIFSSVVNNFLDKIAVKIKQGLKSEKSKTTFLNRGDFGSLNDMKPTIHKQIKTWRRVRNTGAKMFRLIRMKK